MAAPMRMCAGCRERASKKDLIRIVRTPDGEIIADAREKASGRGAYLCRKASCLQKARKSRALERMLKTDIQPEIYERLETILNATETE